MLRVCETYFDLDSELVADMVEFRREGGGTGEEAEVRHGGA